LIICPACGGKRAPSVKSFFTLAEPTKIGGGPVSVGITIRRCEKCSVEFPAIMSRRKYSLVPEKEVQDVVRELSKLKEENRNLERNLSELQRTQDETHKRLEDLGKESELSVMMRRLSVLEEEVSYFRSEKRQLEWLLSSLRLANHMRK
jgi:predicted RNase H-like nuclease (RuvC/YqgF family)